MNFFKYYVMVALVICINQLYASEKAENFDSIVRNIRSELLWAPRDKYQDFYSAQQKRFLELIENYKNAQNEEQKNTIVKELLNIEELLKITNSGAFFDQFVK